MSNLPARTDLADELTQWEQFSTEGSQQHLPRGAEILKFLGDRGEWVLPKADPDSDLRGMELVADVRNIHHGWTKFNGNRVEDQRIVKAPGRPARRSELGDTDKDQWELGLDGKTPKDPWNFAHYLPMFGREHEEMYVYITSSMTGGREIKNLAAIYVDKVREKGNPDRLPIVKLDREKFKSRFGSRLFAPTLNVIGWRVMTANVEAVADAAPKRKVIEAPAKSKGRPEPEPAPRREKIRSSEPEYGGNIRAGKQYRDPEYAEKSGHRPARDRDRDDDFDNELPI